MQDFAIDENTLPISLQEDINALKSYHNGELDAPEDCLYMELDSSIKSSQYGCEITKEVADYLRAKYLGIGDICEYAFINSKAKNE